MKLTSEQIVEVKKVMRAIRDITVLVDYETESNVPMLMIVETDIDIMVKELNKLKTKLQNDSKKFEEQAEKLQIKKCDIGYNPYQE